MLMPVGPGEREVERADDVIASIVHHQPDVDVILLIDDAPHDRTLSELGGPGRPVAVTANPRDGSGHGLWGGLAAGMLHGYGWLHKEAQPDAVVKLDTDALVVAPFASGVAAALADPQVGMAGTAYHHCNGEPRSFELWPWLVRRRRFPVRPFHEDNGAGPLRLRHTLWGPKAVLRRRIAAARRRGYAYGEHCLGGSYAVPDRFLDEMARRGWFDDWSAWVPHDIGEDVCIAVYVRAVGLALGDANRTGEPFGVEYETLPGSFEEIEAAGYAIIHSIKDQPGLTEAEIRTHFASRRAASEPA